MGNRYLVLMALDSANDEVGLLEITNPARFREALVWHPQFIRKQILGVSYDCEKAGISLGYVEVDDETFGNVYRNGIIKTDKEYEINDVWGKLEVYGHRNAAIVDENGRRCDISQLLPNYIGDKELYRKALELAAICQTEIEGWMLWNGWAKDIGCEECHDQGEYAYCWGKAECHSYDQGCGCVSCAERELKELEDYFWKDKE